MDRGQAYALSRLLVGEEAGLDTGESWRRQVEAAFRRRRLAPPPSRAIVAEASERRPDVPPGDASR